MERILSRGEVRLLRNDVDVDETGVMEVPYANLTCVAAGCHGTMSQPGARGGCHKKMPQQDVTASCHSRMSQQDSSKMSRESVTPAAS